MLEYNVSLPATKQVPLLGQVAASTSSIGVARRWLARRVQEVRRLDGIVSAGSDGNGMVRRERDVLVAALLPPPRWVPTECVESFGKLAKRCAGCCADGTLNVHEEYYTQRAWDDVVKQAEEMAHEAELSDVRLNNASWAGWVERSLKGGAEAAHAFVKGGQC